MSSKLRLWFGGAVGLLLVVVIAQCGTDAPEPTGMSEGVTLAGKGTGAGPRTTDPNPPGWESSGILSHDGFPTDINFEGVGLACFGAITEEYAGIGVHFSGDAVALVDGGCLNSFNYPPHSPVTVLIELTDGVVTVDFDTPRSDVGVRYI